ncbi:MAG: helix-turn-helix transcriptional regulator [Clostridiales bacterium]|nr:helix-turn-helix transcriptional regulator [Clostridiales bacterium]
MDETTIKKTIAENIAYYRKKIGLTQSELSEKINYSDKSVSKWERGDGLPDVLVLSELAELYGVTLNDLVSTDHKKDPAKRRARTRVFVTLLSAGLPWLVAAVVYFIVKLAAPGYAYAEHFFLYAIAICGIVSTVLTTLWFSHVWQMLSVSMIVWGVAVSVHFTCRLPQAIYIYIIAAVMQVLTLFWFTMKKIGKKS